MQIPEMTARTITRDQIEEIVNGMNPLDIVDAIQEGFLAYSGSRVEVPPVGEMLFDDPPGETRIK